jgi:hypothetical protein
MSIGDSAAMTSSSTLRAMNHRRAVRRDDDPAANAAA